jgi:hypothetical protein
MTRTIFTPAGLALAIILPSVSAQAQSIRTYVSVTGSDSSASCSLTQPCRHFQAAVAATSVGGEVDALDPGGYGAVTINQAITIDGQGWSYVAPGPNGNAITVNVNIGGVALRGLSLNGVGNTDSTGIYAGAAEELEIVNCTIRNFSNYGILVSTTGFMSVQISNSVVSDITYNSGSYGIFISSGQGGQIIAAMNEDTVDNNWNGIYVEGYNATAVALISNSHVDNNAGTGVTALGAGNDPGGVGYAVLKNVTINQTPYGVQLQGNASVWFSQVTIADFPGFNSVGVNFTNSNNSALSDGTSHLGTAVGGNIAPWSLQ